MASEMDVLEFHYYVGEGPENDKLLDEVVVRCKERDAARSKLAAEYGACGGAMRDGKAVGLLFDKMVKRKYLRREGYKGEDGTYMYLPRRNTKKGKELAARMAAENDVLTFNPADCIVEELDVYRRIGGPHKESPSGKALYHTGAGFVDGKILVQIPGPKDEEFPEVPEWLREVSKDEWKKLVGSV